MGYMHTAPREKGRRSMTETKAVTRARAILDAGGIVPMPPLSAPARYLAEHLLTVGPAMPGAMGQVAVTFSELRAYQDSMGVEFAPWESRALREASQAYINASHDAESPDAAPPWVSMAEQNRERVSNMIGSVFGARAKRKGT